MGISGKTGTAQVLRKGRMDHITWFVSFAPFQNPKYAVVVMIESGQSGGGTCAPKAKEIYKTIQKIENERLKKMAAQ
jgi:penicillin-binding protein 2